MYSSSDGQGPDIGPGPGGGAFKFVQTKRKRAKHTHALASATFVCYIMQQKFLLPRPGPAQWSGDTAWRVTATNLILNTKLNGEPSIIAAMGT